MVRTARNSGGPCALCGSHAPTRARPHAARRSACSAPPRPRGDQRRARGRLRVGARPGGARRGVRGPDAGQARRAPDADALHAADALARRAELAPAARRRLRQVADEQPRDRPLRLHQARDRAGGARLLPDGREVPLARRRRPPRRLGEVDLGGLPPGRPAARTCARSACRPSPAPTARTPATSCPVVNRGRSGRRRVRRRRVGRRHDADARAGARARAAASARSSRSRARRARTGRS